MSAILKTLSVAGAVLKTDFGASVGKEVKRSRLAAFHEARL